VPGKGKVELDVYRDLVIFKNDIPAKGTVCQPQIKPRPDFYSLKRTAPQFPGTMPENFIGLRFSIGKHFFPLKRDKIVVAEVQINCIDVHINRVSQIISLVSLN
jgi:hypothetical protein